MAYERAGYSAKRQSTSSSASSTSALDMDGGAVYSTLTSAKTPKPAGSSGSAAGRRLTDWASIRGELQGSGALYADPDFPPEPRSLTFDGRLPPNLRDVIWKRPKDLFRQPEFIHRGATRHDLDQGLLGNCWFIAGAATLATSHQKMFERVVPPDQSFDKDYTGIFRFHFWWYGSWKEVYVDDYLPTDGRRLVYCSNRERPNELWPALLEKAYAKLRGCYQGIDGGKLHDALVDMTGGISEVVYIDDKTSVPPDLFELMYRSRSMRSLLGGAIYRPNGVANGEVLFKNGLYGGHAYSITGLEKLKGPRGDTLGLIRVRNPWGRDEWRGAWSDNSPEMRQLPESVKRELGFKNRDDGEFWMSYDDFVANFDEVLFCHLQVDAMIEELEDNVSKQNWNVTVYHDEWIRGVTAGGCGNAPHQRLYWNNPQFHVELKKPDTINSHGGDCTIIVSLMEKEVDNRSRVAIGFDIYKLKNPELRPLNEERAPKNALLLQRRSGSYQFYRESSKRYALPPGHYVIIPSTFRPHEEARFMLRLFTEQFAESSVLEDEVEQPTVVTPKDHVGDCFKRVCGPDSRLDPLELSKFLALISEKDLGQKLNFNVEQSRSLLPMMDENSTGRLELKEATKLWGETKAYREVFLQFDKDRTNSVDTFELASMFTKLGFPVSKPVLTAIVRRYGDRDNRIGLEDFIVVIFRLIQLFNVYRRHEDRASRAGLAEFTRNEFLGETMYL